MQDFSPPPPIGVEEHSTTGTFIYKSNVLQLSDAQSLTALGHVLLSAYEQEVNILLLLLSSLWVAQEPAWRITSCIFK